MNTQNYSCAETQDSDNWYGIDKPGTEDVEISHLHKLAFVSVGLSEHTIIPRKIFTGLYIYSLQCVMDR